jgi:hypothetical protein
MSETNSGRTPTTILASTNFVSIFKVCSIAAVFMIACFAFFFSIESILSARLCPAGTFMRGYSGSDLVPIVLILSGAALCISLALLLTKVGIGYAAGDERNEKKVISRYIGLRRSAILLSALISSSLLALDAPFLWFDMHCVFSVGVLERELPWKAFAHYGWSDVKNLTIECSYVEGSRSEPGYWSDELRLIMNNGVNIGLGGGQISNKIDPEQLRLADTLRQYTIVIDSSQVPAGCTPPELKAFAKPQR